MKSRAPASTLKKAVIVLLNRTAVKGYLNSATLGQASEIDLLTLDGEQRLIPLAGTRSVYFVREFKEPFEPERKTFLSRPKLDGLWVRLRFRDEDVMEGIVSNNLLDLLDTGVRMTPPDLHGNVLHMFIPRAALIEMKVLGVARRTPQAARDSRAGEEAQSKLFGE